MARFLFGILTALFGRWIDNAVESLKIEAATHYVNGVQKARQAFIALLGSFLLLLLMMCGFLLIHVALFVWLPWALPVKAIVLLALGAVYLGVGLAIVGTISSERNWVKFTNVDRIVRNLTKK